MADTPVIIRNATSRFFDNYLNCLENASVPETQRRWYVKRVEEFIRAQNDHKIKGLLAADIPSYFEMLDRQNRLSGASLLFDNMLAAEPQRRRGSSLARTT